MDTARCTLDNEVYTIWVFSQLPPAQIERYRRHLICDECGFSAYYRRESSDGKPPCFGATHQAGCKAASSTANISTEERRDIEDVNKIIAADDTIRINFTLPLNATHDSDEEENNDYSGRYGTPSKRHSKEPAKSKIVSRGLKTILNYLIRSPGFADSDTMICTDSKHCWKAKNLIVPFENAEADKRPHMYWGMISHSDQEMKWLNTGEKDNVSIPISRIKDSLVDAFDIEDGEDFAGAYAIVFGWCKAAKSGKLYIDVKGNDPSCIFIKLPRR